MRMLIGDIGGTNTRLAIAENGAITQIVTWPSRGGLEPLLKRFLASTESVAAVCLAVAGPVFGGRVHLTNLGWHLDAEALSAQLGVPVRLINDFHAQALAVTALSAAGWVELAPTRRCDQAPGECIAVLGAGTGLGEAILAPDARGDWVVVAGEGSHKRFAPRNAREIGLLEAFTARYGEHVSVERVASGPGLVAIYDYLRGDTPRHPGMAQAAPAAVITREALANGCPICRATIELFIGVLADEAAGLALQCNAGAVYLGGGIAPRLLPLLDRYFRPAFETKGRYGAWLATVPVRILTHPDPGLLGARLAGQDLG